MAGVQKDEKTASDTMARSSSVQLGQLGHSYDDPKDDGRVDVAAQYADQFTEDNAYSRKEEVKLRWKLDLRLVPLLWFNVTLGAMDKVTTSTAALYNFRAATGLTGNRYSWVGSAFYVSLD